LASFKYCIDEAIKGKKINKQVADRLRESDDPEIEIQDMVEEVSRVQRVQVLALCRCLGVTLLVKQGT
jgi:hypothetical protein